MIPVVQEFVYGQRDWYLQRISHVVDVVCLPSDYKGIGCSKLKHVLKFLTADSMNLELEISFLCLFFPSF